MADEEMFLTSAMVKERYGGVSDMTIHRWRQDVALRFPKPVKINRRNYWRKQDLIAWEQRQAAEAA